MCGFAHPNSRRILDAASTASTTCAKIFSPEGRIISFSCSTSVVAAAVLIQAEPLSEEGRAVRLGLLVVALHDAG